MKKKKKPRAESGIKIALTHSNYSFLCNSHSNHHSFNSSLLKYWLPQPFQREESLQNKYNFIKSCNLLFYQSFLHNSHQQFRTFAFSFPTVQSWKKKKSTVIHKPKYGKPWGCVCMLWQTENATEGMHSLKEFMLCTTLNLPFLDI